ncbi:MAG TPA: L-threonylcarbamoyladenylate synthase [Candidatus Eisenbacteria bacterium]|nr:L-threonylcarbamoyladenylate synthase [Candidatus Eisenbacteria bacterium]
MDVRHVDPEHPDEESLRLVAEAILRGGIVAFPTDTVYGLSCSLFDVGAVEMLARLKRRDPSHAVISLIPDPQQVYGLAAEVNEVAERLIARHWPGPLSLIFLASPLVPPRVRGAGGTVALRCPRDILCQKILAAIGGPVVSSSANLSGLPPARSADEVVRTFGNQLDLVVDGGPRPADRPSTLVDVSGPRPRLLRQGDVEVRAELGDFEDATRTRSG